MRSPTTMGEECPGGKAVFQRTLVVVPISAGRGESLAGNPEQLGPRNWGQSEAVARLASRVRLTRAVIFDIACPSGIRPVPGFRAKSLEHPDRPSGRCLPAEL